MVVPVTDQVAGVVKMVQNFTGQGIYKIHLPGKQVWMRYNMPGQALCIQFAAGVVNNQLACKRLSVDKLQFFRSPGVFNLINANRGFYPFDGARGIQGRRYNA